MDRVEFEYCLERNFEDKHASFKRIFGRRTDEAYMVISEYFFYPEGSFQRIGIRIVVNMRGDYGYQCSHGSGYRSSINNCFDSEEIALHNALDEALSYYKYDPEDENRVEKWVQNDDYYALKDGRKRAIDYIPENTEEVE